MAGVLVKIGALKKNLPKAERLVADYLEKSPEKAGFQSISEIAESVSVSVASVSRLSKKLEYANYKELRMDLAMAVMPVPLTPRTGRTTAFSRRAGGGRSSLTSPPRASTSPRPSIGAIPTTTTAGPSRACPTW